MYKVFLLANQDNEECPLADAVSRAELSCRVGPDLAPVEESEASSQPDVVLLDLASVDSGQARGFIDRCKKLRLPVVAVLPRESAARYDPSLNPDELLFCPIPDGELLVRIRQAVYRVMR